MAKTTALPLATLPLSGAELLPIVQGGVSKRAPLSALPDSAAVFAQAEAAKYGITLGPDAAGLYDLSYWRTDLFKPDGVTRVTAPGDRVGLFKNRLRIASLNLRETVEVKCGFFGLFMGIPYIYGGPDTGLSFEGNQTLKAPMFLLAAARAEEETLTDIFGLKKNTGDEATLSKGLIGNFRASYIGTSPARAWTQPSSENMSAPPKGVGVLHSHIRAGWVDMRMNDDIEDPGYSPLPVGWADGDTVTDMSGGVNVGSQAGGLAVYRTNSWSFFGGCILFGIKEFDRDALVGKFMASTTPKIRPQDKHIVIITDSQADDFDRLAGNFGAYPTQPGPVSNWVLKHLAPANPTASIMYRKASVKGDYFSSWRADQVGSSDQRIFITNLAVAGSQPNFFLGDKREKMLGSFDHVNDFIIAHGGNLGSPVADPNGYMKMGEYKALIDVLWELYPDANIGMLGPYKFHNDLPDTMAVPNAACNRAATHYGITVLSTYPNWGPDLANFFFDRAHLSYGTAVNSGIVKRDGEINTLYTAMLAANITKGQTSIGYGTNGIANGNFRTFEPSGLPTGMTKFGPVTVTKSTKRADIAGGLAYGVRLQQTSGFGYVTWTIDATPYRGKVVTAMISLTQSGRRQGAHSSEGQLKLGSNGTGAVDPNSWIWDSSAQGGGAQHYAPLSRPIAADATTITATMVCGNGGPADLTLHFISLVEGENGKIPV